MDTLTPEERSERMGRVRSKNTKPEMLVRRLVHGMGYRYRLHDRHVPGSPDMVFARRRKVVFVHGCFWHRHDCPSGRRVPKIRVEFWLPKLEKNEARDKHKMGELRAAGWEPLIVWECETRDLAVLADRLRTFLNA